MVRLLLNNDIHSILNEIETAYKGLSKEKTKTAYIVRPHYAVALALTGGDWRQLLGETYNDPIYILTILLLKLITNAVELPDGWLISISNGLDMPLPMPKNINTCEEARNKDICETAVKAAYGDQASLNALRNEVIKYGILQDLANTLSVEELYETLAPRAVYARLTLILHNLLNGNYELAKAHAIMEAHKSSKFSALFKELSDVLSRNRGINEEIKSLLIKLYYLSTLPEIT